MNIDLQIPLCPTCGGALYIPTGETSVKCKFCRNTIIVAEAVKQGKISVDGIPTLADSIAAGYTFLEVKEFSHAFESLNKALQIAPNNHRIWWGLVLVGTRNFTTYENGIFKNQALNAVKFAPDKNTEESLRTQYNQFIEKVNNNLDYQYGSGWKENK